MRRASHQRRRAGFVVGAGLLAGLLVGCGARGETRDDAPTAVEPVGGVDGGAVLDARTDTLHASGSVVVPSAGGFYDDDGTTWIPAVAHSCVWSVYGLLDSAALTGAEVLASRDDGWSFVRCTEASVGFTPNAGPSEQWIQGVVVHNDARYLTDRVVVSVGRDARANLTEEPYATTFVAAGVFSFEPGPLPGLYIARAADPMAASVALVESGLFRWAQPDFVRPREVREF